MYFKKKYDQYLGGLVLKICTKKKMAYFDVVLKMILKIKKK